MSLATAPTSRKVRNRGYTPVRYRQEKPHDEVRNGWILVKEDRRFKMQLVGDERARWYPNSELKYVTEL